MNQFDIAFLLFFQLILLMDQNRNLVCQFCFKQISAANHTLHEIHCARTKKFCQICLQFLDQNMISQHRLTHKEFICPKCKQSFTGNQQNHNLTCKIKFEYCIFCDSDIPNYNFKVHRQTCSKHTKVCAWCRNKIQIIEYSYHITYCKYKNDTNKYSMNNSQTTIKNRVSQRILNRRFDDEKMKKSQQIIRQESTSLEKKCKPKHSIQFQDNRIRKRNNRNSKNYIQQKMPSILKINSGLDHHQEVQAKIVSNQIINQNLEEQVDALNPIPISVKNSIFPVSNFFQNYQNLLASSIHK